MEQNEWETTFQVEIPVTIFNPKENAPDSPERMVGMVETGEGRTPSYPTVQRLVRERRALAVAFHVKEQI